ncbi:MAG TPA: DegT/DnrJ/EryC1/StrS family aminotransferase [Acidobacteriaceae bacterium]|nr:DegT/DnrJ/EryC1/StrS family aminotransferase [Acidobacteriaceae bacterium]
MNIPLSAPDITDAEIDAVTAVLRTSRLSLGPKLTEFESAFAQYIGTPHAIAVSSGTAGLHLCIRALSLGPSDEVIVPSFTFIAAANAIRYERATPVFVDIDPVTLNATPELIEAAITPRTRAILAVHTFGVPADMPAILDIARRHNLPVIEDACEAIGASLHNRRVGSFGDAAVFAFYPNKQITTGEGGMVVTSNAEFAEHIRALRNQGRYPSDDWLQHSELGFNYRLSELACALGLAQLQRIDSILAARAEVARRYRERLVNLPLALQPLEISNATISWFVYVVRLHDRYSQPQRDALLRVLTHHGIGCARYFAPIHLQPAYFDWRDVRLPVTEAVSARTLALPFFNRLTAEQQDYVCGTLSCEIDRL